MIERSRLGGILGIALFVAILAAAVVLGPERAVGVLLGLGDSAWLLPIVFGLYLIRPFVGWPHSPFPVAAGFYFDLLGGPLVAFVGLLLTSLPPFAVGRYLNDEGALARLGAVGERFTGATGEIRAVASARLLPLPADLVSYGAGVGGVRTRAFALGTLVGDVPWLVGLVFVGTQLETITAEGVDALLALVGLALLARPLAERVRS
ncbi:MAG: VTT domain-containing protein [Halalkalicoccus sp.]